MKSICITHTGRSQLLIRDQKSKEQAGLAFAQKKRTYLDYEMDLHAVQLPPELWQHIIDMISLKGRSLHLMAVRETMCNLQQSCKLFYEICTPIIYQNCYIISNHGYHNYLASVNSSGYTKPAPRNLLLSGIRALSDPRPLIEAISGVSRLHLLVDGDWSPTIFELPEHLEEYAGQHPLYTTVSDLWTRFDRLERMCLIDNSFVNQIVLALRCPSMQEVIMISPFGMQSIMDITETIQWLTAPVKQRMSTPRITILSPLARTIDNPGFRRIQDTNVFLDNLARSIYMVDLPLYRLSAEYEGPGGGDGSQRFLAEDSPFQDFVQGALGAGKLFEYCRRDGFRCGQASGLGMALVPW